MRLDDETMVDVVTRLHAAAVTPERWPDALQAIADWLQLDGGAVFVPGGAARGPFGAAVGTAEHSLPLYQSHWHQEDVWIQAVARAGHAFRFAGTVEFGGNVLPQADLRRSAFHADFLAPHGIEYILSLKVCDTSDGLAPDTHLSFYRPASREDFGSRERARLSALWPHVQRAVHTHWLLERGRATGGAAEAVLDAMPLAVWVVRDDLLIDFANRAARRAMSHLDWVRAAGRTLIALGSLDGAQLRQAVHESSLGGRRRWVASHASGGRLHGAVLRVAPLAEAPASLGAWPHARCLLCIELEPEPLPQWLGLLAGHYGTTPAETRVLNLLAQGHDAREIAARCGISYTTVRTHLRALFEKTGCRRQAELVRLAAAWS